jgi:hypothetical protein
MIEFDVETTGLQPWSQTHEAFLWIFSDGENHEAITFWPHGSPDGDVAQEGDRNSAHRRIQAWFDRGKAEGIRAWNQKFDRAFADAAECFEVPGDGCWHDGMVEAHTIDERRRVQPELDAADSRRAQGARRGHELHEREGRQAVADAENLRAVDDELAARSWSSAPSTRCCRPTSADDRPLLRLAMNTYKEPFIAPDSRIHANYRQVGARTGRMSCSDPNMQNQPRDDLRLRYNIVADPGHVLVTCDLSNIEMVLFAAYCGEGRCSTLSGRRGPARPDREDAGPARPQASGRRHRDGPAAWARRTTSRASTAAACARSSAPSAARWTRRAAQEALRRRLPGGQRSRTASSTAPGRRLHSGQADQRPALPRRPQDAYKATNYLVQGTAAALLKYAVIKLHADGVPMVALVHDEIVAHVPVETRPGVAKLIEKRMTEFEGLEGRRAAARGGRHRRPLVGRQAAEGFRIEALPELVEKDDPVPERWTYDLPETWEPPVDYHWLASIYSPRLKRPVEDPYYPLPALHMVVMKGPVMVHDPNPDYADQVPYEPTVVMQTWWTGPDIQIWEDA